MNAKRRRGKARGERAGATLGDLLYADKARKRVPEQDWVLLVRRVAGGDQLALHALYERTRRMVFTLTMRITGSRQTAEEVTLDVYHDVWKRASTYDPAGGTVLGWIMNQARSRAIDRVRFEQRRKRVNPYPEGAVPASSGNEAQDVLDVGQQAGILRDALSTLTPEERAAIETAYFSEITYAEAAQRLNQPIGTVKTRIRSALEKLRQRLAAGVRKS